MQVKLGVSNRHVHLNQEDYQILFKDEPLEKVRDLVQTGEFASNQFVEIQVGDKVLSHVRVIGPLRGYTQVELSKTDARALKINPPVRTSSDLEGACPVTLIGPYGQVTKPCAILANRHIHINPQMREALGLVNVEKVCVLFESEKKTLFYDVFIKEQEKGVLELHLDTDDANGACLKTGDIGEVFLQKSEK